MWGSKKKVHTIEAEEPKQDDECKWRTVNGTPVCFKDGEDPQTSMDKAFKNKPKRKKGTKNNRKRRETELKKIKQDFKEKIKDLSVEELDEVLIEDNDKVGEEWANIKHIDTNSYREDGAKNFKFTQEDFDEYGIGDKFSNDPVENKKVYMEEMWNQQGSWTPDEKRDHEKFSNMFDRAIERNPTLQKDWSKFEEDATRYDAVLESKFEKTDSLWRGTNIEELDSYQEHNAIGIGDNKYNYVATTMEERTASRFGNIEIEYDADSLKEAGANRVEYVPKPQPFGVSSGLKDYEEIGKPMSFDYRGEEEVRVREGTPLDEVRIKNIHFKDLGEPFYNDGSRIPYDERVNVLQEKYGNLADNLTFRPKKDDED